MSHPWRTVTGQNTGTILLLVLLSFLLLPENLFPQRSAEKEKEPLTIGLALGGGGARGFAHVGILRWMEENQIPIDYVAGTSIGGLIGGLYAMGYSAEEMTELIQALDWDKLLAANPPFEALTFRRKEDAVQYPVQLELGIRNGEISTPTGLNAGHFIGLLFDRLTIPYDSIETFSELPTPFVCLATDMESAEEIVLDRGSLSTALRATMAIPGVFTPVEREGRLLADGGVLNNVPVNALKDLGLDVLIAVDVGAPLRGGDELESLFGLIDQSINIMMIANVRRNAALADLFLSPDVAEWDTLSFKEFSPIYRKGYEAAAEKELFLKTLSVSDDQWSEFLKRRSDRRRQGYPLPQTLLVEGTDPRRAEALAARLQPHLGKPLEPDSLEEELTSVYGTGLFYRAGYSAGDQEDPTRLRIRLDEKKYGPPFIRFGVRIDGSEFDDIAFGLRSRMTSFGLIGPKSELRLDLGIGAPWRLAGELYIPVKGRWFVSPSAVYNRSRTNLFEDRSRVSEYVTSTIFGAFDLGYGVGLAHDEIRFGYRFGDEKASLRIGEAPVPTQEGAVGVASARWLHNRTDNPVIPRSGHRLNLGVEHFFHSAGSEGSFTQALGELQFFGRINRKGSLFASISGGTTFDRDSPLQHEFTLGGPLRLGAFARDEFRGSRFVFSGFGYSHEIGDAPVMFNNRLYLAAWYELGAAFQREGPRDFLNVVSGGLFFDSVVGPILFGGSWGEGGHGRLYFTVGSLIW